MKLKLNSSARPYTIHFNLHKDASSRDILKSYVLGRLIDHHIEHELKQSEDKYLSGELTQLAVRRAEWEFQQLDFEKDIEKPMQ